MVKLRKISYLLIAIFALNNCSAKLVEINNFNTVASSKLGDVKLHHDEYGFCVEQDGELRDVQNCFVDKEIRNLTTEELQIQLGNIKKVEIDGQEIIFERLFPKSAANFSDLISGCESKTIQLSEEESEEIISTLSQSAYIQISQMSDGEFALYFHPRLPGGGPVAGCIAYWVTKTVCYGIGVAGVGFAVVGTGGVAGAVTGAMAAGAATGASAGAGVVAGAIAGAGLTEGAALVTAGAVASTGTVSATIAMIEGGATAVGLFFGALPTP